MQGTATPAANDALILAALQRMQHERHRGGTLKRAWPAHAFDGRHDRADAR
jgi:hypothetical protein